MHMNQVRERARELGIAIRVGTTKIEAIRSIQRAEGYEDCFGRQKWDVCGQEDCIFRAACMKVKA